LFSSSLSPGEASIVPQDERSAIFTFLALLHDRFVSHNRCTNRAGGFDAVIF
jgi:hypothetical protein